MELIALVLKDRRDLRVLKELKAVDLMELKEILDLKVSKDQMDRKGLQVLKDPWVTKARQEPELKALPVCRVQAGKLVHKVPMDPLELKGFKGLKGMGFKDKWERKETVVHKVLQDLLGLQVQKVYKAVWDRRERKGRLYRALKVYRDLKDLKVLQV